MILEAANAFEGYGANTMLRSALPSRHPLLEQYCFLYFRHRVLFMLLILLIQHDLKKALESLLIQ